MNRYEQPSVGDWILIVVGLAFFLVCAWAIITIAMTPDGVDVFHQ